MQLNFDVNRSLKANPPKYGKGITWIERKVGKLKTLRTTDSKGHSLQPREFNIEASQRDLTHSFRVNNVMYDKEVMVAELCDDNIETLASGFGRKATLESESVDTYFWDVVKFDSPYWKAIWKRRFNTGKDHIGKGTPNTEGTYIKGLVELKEDKSFDFRNDDAVLLALEEMSDGQLDQKQKDKLLTKFRKSNSKSKHIVAMEKKDANEAARKLGLATSGYVKDISSSSFGKLGYVLPSGDLEPKLIEWAKKFDMYNTDETPIQIEVTGYIQYTELSPENISKKRKDFMKQFEKSIETLKQYLGVKYHNMIVVKGFLAQDKSPDSFQGGKAKERGLVDVDGNIIQE